MNLLVIGPGHLGARVATLWQARYPEAKIALKAHRDDSDREAKWQSLGFIPYKDPNQRYSNVLFAAPPSGTGGSIYAKSVEDAVVNCTSKGGRFVFTSSGGVYSENSGGIVDEGSDVLFPEDDGNTITASEANPRAENIRGILRAEKAVLRHPGGIVLRFGGLYTLTRGPHAFWLSGKISESKSEADGLINLVHYDDAAEAIMSAFKSKVDSPEAASEAVEADGKLFLVGDGHALSRLEICNAGALNKLYTTASIPNFIGSGGAEAGLEGGNSTRIDGKRYNVAKVRSRLQWRPNFAHFSSFMAQDYVHEMKVPLLDPINSPNLAKV